MTAATPFSVASDLLTAATSVEETLSAPFVRKLVEVSSPRIADDVRQLLVAVDRVGTEKPRVASSLPAGMCAAVPQVVCVVRFTSDCAPQPSTPGVPPDADAVAAWAEDLHEDWWLIYTALVAACTGGDVGNGASSVTMDDALSFGPAGTTGGWTVMVRALLG